MDAALGQVGNADRFVSAIGDAGVHLATMGEDLPVKLAEYSDRIGHVQIADPPGRGMPGTGTLDFEPLCFPGRLRRAGVRRLPSSLVAGAPRSSVQTAGRAFGSRAEL